MRIMAIDPGVTTGWAVGEVHDGALTVVSSGYTPWFEFAVTFCEAMEDPDRRFDHVVYETWRLYRKEALTQIGSDMPSSQCVGAVRVAVERARRDGHRATISDQPATIKNVIDSYMGGAPAYLPSSEVEHDRDALRHLHYWFTFKRKDHHA